MTPAYGRDAQDEGDGADAASTRLSLVSSYLSSRPSPSSSEPLP